MNRPTKSYMSNRVGPNYQTSAVAHQDKRTVTHQDKRTVAHQDKRTVTHQDTRTVAHQDKRTYKVRRCEASGWSVDSIIFMFLHIDLYVFSRLLVKLPLKYPTTGQIWTCHVFWSKLPCRFCL